MSFSTRPLSQRKEIGLLEGLRAFRQWGNFFNGVTWSNVDAVQQRRDRLGDYKDTWRRFRNFHPLPEGVVPPNGIIHPDGKLFILLSQYNLIFHQVFDQFRYSTRWEDRRRGILSSILSIILLFVECCNIYSVTFHSSSRDNARSEIRIQDFRRRSIYQTIS